MLLEREEGGGEERETSTSCLPYTLPLGIGPKTRGCALIRNRIRSLLVHGTFQPAEPPASVARCDQHEYPSLCPGSRAHHLPHRTEGGCSAHPCGLDSTVATMTSSLLAPPAKYIPTQGLCMHHPLFQIFPSLMIFTFLVFLFLGIF